MLSALAVATAHIFLIFVSACSSTSIFESDVEAGLFGAFGGFLNHFIVGAL